MKRFYYFLIWSYLFFSSATIFPAQKLQFGIGRSYNSNIFRLSPYDAERFSAFEYPKMKTEDDFITVVNIQFQKSINFAGSRNLFRIDFSYKNYEKNPAHDFSVFKVYLRRYLNRKDYFEIRYFVLPSYFTRYYRDRDSAWLSGYPCKYGDQRYRVKLSLHPGILNTLQFYLQVQQLFFSPRFTEYDQNIYIAGLNFYRALSGLQRLGVLTSFRYSDNINKSSYSDLSFREYRIGVYYRKRGYLLPRREAEFKYTSLVRLRQYTTRNLPSEDEFHTGRKSYRISSRGELIFPILKRFKLDFFGEYEFRKVITGEEIVKRLKKFSAAEVGISLDFRFF